MRIYFGLARTSDAEDDGPNVFVTSDVETSDYQGLNLVAHHATRLNPRYDQVNHSPSGYAWGYGGSGPAQLAFALIADAVDVETARECYQDFKFLAIGNLPMEQDWAMTDEIVRTFVRIVRTQRRWKSERYANAPQAS